jgi:hypothetical protein
VCKANKEIKRRVENARTSPVENRQKVLSLMLGKNLINLAEAVIEKKNL